MHHIGLVNISHVLRLIRPPINLTTAGRGRTGLIAASLDTESVGSVNSPYASAHSTRIPIFFEF